MWQQVKFGSRPSSAYHLIKKEEGLASVLRALLYKQVLINKSFQLNSQWKALPTVPVT